MPVHWQGNHNYHKLQLGGVGVGTGSDSLPNMVGVKFAKHALQGISGVTPALILCCLAMNDRTTDANAAKSLPMLNPVTMLAMAQTTSAASLGGACVSHLEVAPQHAGPFHALGNVTAAESECVTVDLGRLLEASGDTDFGHHF